MALSKLLIVHGGELAKDIAERIAAKKPTSSSITDVSVRCGSERPKKLLDVPEDTLVCFVMQTIENAAPTDEVSRHGIRGETGFKLWCSIV